MISFSAIAILVPLIALADPTIALRDVDKDGCGTLSLANQTLLDGGPRGFCVHQALTLVLDGEATIALLVSRRDAKGGSSFKRVFLYRLHGRHLLPRFLSSGLPGLKIESLSVDENGERLKLRGRKDDDAAVALSCWFEQFPLVCEEVDP